MKTEDFTKVAIPKKIWRRIKKYCQANNLVAYKTVTSWLEETLKEKEGEQCKK